MRIFSLIISVLVALFTVSACGPTVGKAIGETPNNTPDVSQLSAVAITASTQLTPSVLPTATLMPTSTPIPTVTPTPLMPDTKTVLKNSKVVMDRLSSYRYKGTMVISEPVSGFELPLNFDAVAQPPDKLSEKLSFEMMGMLLEGEERKVRDRYFSLEPMEEGWNEVTSYDGPDFATIWSGSGEEESLFELPLSGTPEIEEYAAKEAYLIEFDLIESLGDPSLANNFLSFFDFDATEDSLDDMEKFHITYWIDLSTYHLVGVELELAIRDDAILEGLVETDDAVSYIYLNVNLLDFDQVNEPILVPENIAFTAPAAPAIPTAPAPAMPAKMQEIETLAPLTSYPSELRVKGHFSLDGTYNLKWDGNQLQTYNGMPQWINSDCGIAFGCFIYYHRPVPSSIRNGKNLADGVWALSDAVPSNMWVMNAYYDNIGYPWELNFPGWTLTFGTSFIEDELTVEAFYWPDDTVKASLEMFSSLDIMGNSSGAMAQLESFIAEETSTLRSGNFSYDAQTIYEFAWPDNLKQTSIIEFMPQNVVFEWESLKLQNKHYTKNPTTEWTETEEFNGSDVTSHWTAPNGGLNWPIQSEVVETVFDGRDVYHIVWHHPHMSEEPGYQDVLNAVRSRLELDHETELKDYAVNLWIDKESYLLIQVAAEYRLSSSDSTLENFPLESDFATVVHLLRFSEFNEPNRTSEMDPEVGLKDFYGEGEKLMAEGNFSQAIESLTKHLEMYPDSGAGYHKRGEAFFAMQQYVSAIGNLDRAIELGIQEPNIYGMLGKSFLELEEYEVSIDKFETLRFMEPKNPLPYHYMGICFMELKRYKEAIHSWEIFASIREKEKDFKGHAYRNLGIAYMRLGLFSAAIEYFDQALEIEPGSDALDIKKDILSGAVETSDPEEASKIAKSLSTSRPEVLEVKHKNNQAYSGHYFLEGSYNNAPVWINYGCSAAGAYGDELGHFWGCFIFKWSAADEWVLQPLPPSKEWLADAMVNGTAPWEGVVTEGLDFIRIPDLIPVSKSN